MARQQERQKKRRVLQDMDPAILRRRAEDEEEGEEEGGKQEVEQGRERKRVRRDEGSVGGKGEEFGGRGKSLHHQEKVNGGVMQHARTTLEALSPPSSREIASDDPPAPPSPPLLPPPPSLPTASLPILSLLPPSAPHKDQHERRTGQEGNQDGERDSNRPTRHDERLRGVQVVPLTSSSNAGFDVGLYTTSSPLHPIHVTPLASPVDHLSIWSDTHSLHHENTRPLLPPPPLVTTRPSASYTPTEPMPTPTDTQSHHWSALTTAATSTPTLPCLLLNSHSSTPASGGSVGDPGGGGGGGGGGAASGAPSSAGHHPQGLTPPADARPHAWNTSSIGNPGSSLEAPRATYHHNHHQQLHEHEPEPRHHVPQQGGYQTQHQTPKASPTPVMTSWNGATMPLLPSHKYSQNHQNQHQHPANHHHHHGHARHHSSYHSPSTTASTNGHQHGVALTSPAASYSLPPIHLSPGITKAEPSIPILTNTTTTTPTITSMPNLGGCTLDTAFSPGAPRPRFGWSEDARENERQLADDIETLHKGYYTHISAEPGGRLPFPNPLFGPSLCFVSRTVVLQDGGETFGSDMFRMVRRTAI